METKATRLEKLSECVSVPAFIRVERQTAFILDQVPSWNQYIVRGVSEAEDQDQSSHAGQFITIGPVARDGVAEAVTHIFQEVATIEVIVQEYKQGVSGVVFCFADDFFYVEYSAFPGGVTAGKIRPFVAILPTKEGVRYEKLLSALSKIYAQFGPSDVEFIGIEDPSFVQVRPITSTFDVDHEMVRLQMELQDSLSGKWLENDVAQVVGEHKKYDSIFVSKYVESLSLVFERYFKRSIDVSTEDFIKIGSQYFVSEHFVIATQLNWLDLLKFALIFHREQDRLRNTSVPNVSLEELFERSVLSSMAYTFLKKRDFFDIREEYRRMIDTLLVAKEFSIGGIRRFSYNGQLDSIIELDRQTATWQVIKKRDSFGVHVVPGEFDSVKFFTYQDGKEIPKGAVVLCDYLYPDIGRSIDSISGVICANGSINSHVAILCRERNIPLVIQADLERFCSHVLL